MRVVLDTNVLVSGIFFGGPPSRILRAWESGAFTLIASVDILAEYQRVGLELSRMRPQVEISSILEIIASHADIVQAPPLTPQVCEDADDDKFLSCAQAGNADYVVTGDKLLLKVATFAGIPIVKPKFFLDRLP